MLRAGLSIVCAGWLATATLTAGSDALPAWLQPYKAVADRIAAEVSGSRAAWDRLAEFTDRFPARMSGSKNLEGAIAWAADAMRRDGLDHVRVEPVMVPHWVRGRESAELVEPSRQPLVMAALGGSVGTGPEGLEAEVVVLANWDELQAKAAEVKGRIVVFNPVFRTDIDPLVAYREAGAYRGGGASRAAKLGAVGMLLRSVGPTGHRTPHTGGMRYADDAPKIPAAAITAEDADKLQRFKDRGSRLVVRLVMEAHTLPDAPSANVVAELRGRELPDEVVLVGGHIDSWDLASGATDDGGGCVATWEAVRVLKALKLTPRRTIRVVLFTNEENGLRGGNGYKDAHAAELANHVMALESDTGVFDPYGFGLTGSESSRATLTQMAALLKPLGMGTIGPRAETPDLGPLTRATGLPTMSVLGDMNAYFHVHHTPADTVDKIDPAHLARAVAGIATLAYVVADMPERLK